MTFVHVHLNNEKPKLGSGHRVLFITSQDRKAVRVRDPMNGQTARFTTRDWSAIGGNETTYRKRYIPKFWRKKAPKAWRKIYEAAK